MCEVAEAYDGRCGDVGEEYDFADLSKNCGERLRRDSSPRCHGTRSVQYSELKTSWNEAKRHRTSRMTQCAVAEEVTQRFEWEGEAFDTPT